MPETLTVRSPEWWVKRLSDKLDKRFPSIRRRNDYYEGRHNLQYATKKWRETFGTMLAGVSDNWCGVVVEAPAERMGISGIRIPEEGDGTSLSDQAWEMWQRNELDAWAPIHHAGTLATGYGYVLVWSGENENENGPKITVEDPEQCIVEYEPGSVSTRAAALKRYIDDWTGFEVAYLYLPDKLYRFRRKVRKDGTPDGRAAGGGKVWQPYPGQSDEEGGEEEYPLDNPLEVVPMVEFLNDPSVKRIPRSEIQRVMPMQDGANLLVANMYVAAEFSAYKQRYVLGWTPDVDPEAPAPSKAQVEASISRLMTFQNENIKIGEFSETDLKNYVQAIEMVVHHIAAQTRTPRHYLLQQGQSPSGDAIKSAETGLVAKVGNRTLGAGERWEEVIRLGFKSFGDSRSDLTRAEIRWSDPEYRTEAELTDATIKQFQAGLIPWKTAVERLGYTDVQIKDMERDRTREAVLNQAVDLRRLSAEAEEEEGAA